MATTRTTLTYMRYAGYSVKLIKIFLIPGLGVWMISGHQCDVYVLTFLERIKHFLENGLIDHVSDVNLAYIKASPNIEGQYITVSL